MIIYNDLKNLAPYPLDIDRLNEVLDAEDTIFLDENSLVSNEYYELEKFRKDVYETYEHVPRYIDDCYEHTLLKSNNMIYFAWLIEALTFKFALPGLYQGLGYLNVFLKKILSVIDRFDADALNKFLKQFDWMNNKCASLLNNLSIMPEEITPSYTYADYLIIAKPGSGSKLMQEERQDVLTMEKFKEAVEQCSLEYLQSSLDLINSLNLLMDEMNNAFNKLIEEKSLDEFEKDVFYPCRPLLRDIAEVYQTRVDILLELNKPVMHFDAVTGEAVPGAPQEEVGEANSVEAVRESIRQCIGFLETSFPHTPVIMLLSAAERWLGMSFEQIIDALMQKNASLEALYSMLAPPRPPMGPQGFPGGGGGGFPPQGGGGFPPPDFMNQPPPHF